MNLWIFIFVELAMISDFVKNAILQEESIFNWSLKSINSPHRPQTVGDQETYQSQRFTIILSEIPW